MNKKHITGIISVIFTVAEFIGFLMWGLNMYPGDEMGYALIVIYAAMPLTALVLGAVLGFASLPWIVPVFILKVISHIFLPFLVYGTFEFALSFCISAMPFALGGAIGWALSKPKNK